MSEGVSTLVWDEKSNAKSLLQLSVDGMHASCVSRSRVHTGSCTSMAFSHAREVYINVVP